MHTSFRRSGAISRHGKAASTSAPSYAARIMGPSRFGAANPLPRRVAAAIVVSTFGLGCTSGHERWEASSSRQAVEDGEVDDQHPSVFRLLTRASGSGGLCTATSIAPNLLLTARHCVAQTNTDSIECELTTFHDTIAASGLMSSNDTAPEISSRWFAAAEVIVDERSRQLCGNDIALIRLAENVPTNLARPSSPRFRPEPTEGELYAAVGYGANSNVSIDAEFGVRHARYELPVRCRGASCRDEAIFDNEFSGVDGVCRGDSGGPALDDEGRVIGVLSRGYSGCLSPVYTSVSAFEDWIVEHAERAAELGGYALPEWAGGAPPPERTEVDASPAAEEPERGDDESVSQRLGEEAACRMSFSASGTSALRDLLLLVGFGLVLRRRRVVGRSPLGGISLCALALGGISACSEEAPLGSGDPRSEATPAGDAGGAGRTEATETEATETEPADVIPSDDYTVSSDEVVLTRVYSIMTHETSDVPTTRRAESDDVVVFVAEGELDDSISDEQLNGFLHRMLVRGSAQSYRPDHGVLQTNELVFGALPRDTLPEGKLRVFIVDTEGAGEGYLCGWCESPSDLHLDGHAVAPLDGDLALSIAAHELVHVIHRGYDPDEVTWVDETLAQAAMSVNGFYTDRRWLSDFVDAPNQDWGPGQADPRGFHYGAGLAYGTYLWEQGGPELMRAIIREPENHWAGIDAALTSIGATRTAFELFLEMGVALYFDAPERGFGFDAFNPPGRARTTPVPTAGSPQPVRPYGLVYFRLEEAGPLLLDSANDVHALLVEDAAGDAALNPEVVTLGVASEVTTPPALLVVTATEEAVFSVTR